MIIDPGNPDSLQNSPNNRSVDRMQSAPTGVDLVTFALTIRSYCNRIAGIGLTVKAESL
jgi:hypothetical protein